jgi:hypothetical protein
MRVALKWVVLGMLPVTAAAVLGLQAVTTVAAPPAPETPGGLLLSDLRGPASPRAVPAARAATPEEQLVVDMTGWELTNSSPFGR